MLLFVYDLVLPDPFVMCAEVHLYANFYTTKNAGQVYWSNTDTNASTCAVLPILLLLLMDLLI